MDITLHNNDIRVRFHYFTWVSRIRYASLKFAEESRFLIRSCDIRHISLLLMNLLYSMFHEY